MSLFYSYYPQKIEMQNWLWPQFLADEVLLTNKAYNY